MIRGYGQTNRTDFAHLRRPPVYRITVVQLSISVLLFAVLQPKGNTVSLSALLGGLCYTLPNAYFVWKAFQHSGARSARLIANSFYKGEAGKLLLTAAAFTLVFAIVKPLEPLALFGGFISVLVANWFTPLLIK
ncbi:hypothetical protein ACH42_03745 [Endozoicomonas sp. (ex Bugula neritina AB1)]|nr:hypothetical protein ACH42_03745 [Endozoicomonas sp. (ex Bugula neritina AB1)]